MTQTSSTNSQSVKFAQLMRAGHLAYAAGMPQKAHRIWRRAALLQPHDEQVWLALLNTLENPDDRRVCLQNILILNPNNQQAKRQLQSLLGLDAETQPFIPFSEPAPMPPSRLGRALWIVSAILCGILLAFAAQLAPRLLGF